ncbi:Protein of unknown function [Cotesia congregata]|uniref:Uncharacterized protein n=1 Tax=Cotesia congregata TaxID=51543 RepID=A0A8J2HPU8_COTCN|nr:Protein of unknown function [Cotesia congregata]
MFMKCLLIFIHLLCLFDISEACSCSKIDYKPYSKRVRFLTRLPNSKKIRNLALIGSYSSLSYMANLEESRAQELTMDQQLKYGVRFFDIGVIPKSKSLAVYLDEETPCIDLVEGLDPIERFLKDNPGEIVMVHFAQVFPLSINVTKGLCDILNSLRENGVGKRFVTNWTLEDPIGKHRGKILLASLDFAFYGCAFSLRSECNINYDFVNRYESPITDFREKWESIINLIRASFSGIEKCYVNNMSLIDGKHSRRAISKDGGYKYEYSCIKPINHLIAQNFKKPSRRLVIVLMEFLTQNAIDKVGDSNFAPNIKWRFS